METQSLIHQYGTYMEHVTLAIGFEKMEPTSKEYISWTASSDYKEWEEGHLQGTADYNRVIKLDYIGHVQKHLGKALYDSRSPPQNWRMANLLKVGMEG